MQQGISATIPATTAVGGYVRRFVTEFMLGLRHHALLFAGGTSVFALGYGLSLSTGHMLAASPMEFVIRYVLLAGLIVGLAIVFYKLARMVLVERPEAPIAELSRWLRFDIFSPARLANGANGMIFVFLLMGGFTMAKNNVSRFGGFHWDADFASLDRTLHFGFYPHELLQPLLHPATAANDRTSNGTTTRRDDMATSCQPAVRRPCTDPPRVRRSWPCHPPPTPPPSCRHRRGTPSPATTPPGSPRR